MIWHDTVSIHLIEMFRRLASQHGYLYGNVGAHSQVIVSCDALTTRVRVSLGCVFVTRVFMRCDLLDIYQIIINQDQSKLEDEELLISSEEKTRAFAHY